MKEFRLIQHKLIPLALFMLNIGVIHLVYLLAAYCYTPFVIPIAICSVFMTWSIVKKNKILIYLSVGAYLVVLLSNICL
ncbi:hypothetical protein [Pedobacter metabolipauper]|uniref:Uncharacterized protein n=1 Tax=Pedobacter metabolipauper TaxID=425513 RepID=A0A4R6T0D8_9SPHI|nr:hypothetical protein [Pedobacter metabolipauper]TDQ10285.1 hypothetical protein ATK78_2451 [Pedobacter metabolipauper]